MKEVFCNTTTSQIDAKLYKDILEYEDRLEKFFIVVFFILVFIFRGWIGYWLKFGVAIPNGYSTSVIDVTKEPVQRNYSEDEQRQKTFMYKSLINDKKIEMIPKAHYELSGSVVAYNYNFIFKDSFFDSAALYDLGATWGKLSDKKFYNKYFESYSSKNEISGSRTLWTKAKTRQLPVSEAYAISHWSHSHIVPANRNVMAAMLKLKVWDKVKIEGELVDMRYKSDKSYRTSEYRTSLSRADTNASSRGNGACETVYVTSVQIGNSVYK